MTRSTKLVRWLSWPTPAWARRARHGEPPDLARIDDRVEVKRHARAAVRGARRTATAGPIRHMGLSTVVSTTAGARSG